MISLRVIGLAWLSIAVIPADAEALTDRPDRLVVIGERRERPKDETPASIAVLARDEIVRIDADHPSEALNRMAGVYIHRGNGQEHLTAIRSPILTGGAGAGSFLFLEDGVPLRAPGFANVNELFEANTELADRIEVLRGPSGAVYGANAIHGVINVMTPQPSADASRLTEISVDSIGRLKSKGFVSGSRGANGFWAGLAILDDPGFRLDSGADSQKFLFRHNFDGESFSARTTFAAMNLNQETAGFVEGPTAYRDAQARRLNANPDAFRDAKALRLTSRIETRLSDSVTLSTTPFLRWNEMRFRMHFVPSQAIETNSHWSAGVQNAIYFDGEGPVSAFAGLDIDRTQGTLTELQLAPTVFSYTQGLHYDYDVGALSVSPFASLSLAATPRLTLTAAARVDYTRYDYQNNADDGVVGRFLRPADRIDAFTTVSPKLSAVYAMGRGAVFASYARGARPPQTTDLYRLQINQTADSAQPETIDAFELGVRGQAIDRVRYEVAGYFMKKRNFFFRDADGYNVDDGRTRHLGGEAEISVAGPAGFSVDANVSYGRHSYRFSRAVLSAPQATESITAGDDIDTAPRWLAGARLLWAPNALPLSAELEWTFVDAYFMDAANTITYPGHNIFNLRAAWEISNRVTATFAVRNLSDKLYAERADFAFGSERYFPGEERVVAFGLRVGS